ncbi:PRTRC system protein E [uncultured Alistipes sp.]|uniref:PRTRC system protein E n=1 Tax=uncultured Alistipes sp. TaxID=538949 RepID=UPI00262E7F69|nr:PRTRC system protein E [uncultured Alistipes sp.]
MFFQHIHQIMTAGVDITLVMRKGDDGSMTVSLLPKSQSLKDSAQNRFIPLTLNGTPAELDAGFFPTVAQPLHRTTGLIANIARFEKQAEKAVCDSKASKSVGTAKEKVPKEVREKREKYDRYIRKAEEQTTAKNYAEAAQAYRQARLYASEEQMPQIDAKIAEAYRAQNQGSLFEMLPPAQPAPSAPAVQAAPQTQYAARPIQEQQPQQPMQRYEQTGTDIDPLGMPPYDDPDNPPSYRPDEYARYDDFPQDMVAAPTQIQTYSANM